MFGKVYNIFCLRIIGGEGGGVAFASLIGNGTLRIASSVNPPKLFVQYGTGTVNLCELLNIRYRVQILNADGYVTKWLNTWSHTTSFCVHSQRFLLSSTCSGILFVIFYPASTRGLCLFWISFLLWYEGSFNCTNQWRGSAYVVMRRKK